MKSLLLNKLPEGWKLKALPLVLFTIVVSSLPIMDVGTIWASQSAEVAEYDYSAQSLRTSLWLDKSADEVYRKGDYQTVGFQTNEDAYAVVYRVDSEGLVEVLWPRSRLDDGFVFGGHEYLLPVSGSRRLRVSHQEGEGFVEVVVSRYAFDLRDLAIDFHHEQNTDRLDFYVAGDPFLAMNEVNFAVTGLEDSADYVITDYKSYYVHQKVEHPRYLCVQCHDDNEVAYEPYHDSCTLEISYDYGWYNDWYVRYGYYPVYSQPVYVYVDPWSYNPWVNFWYTPYYSCAPTPYYSWRYSTYCWNDSPYYYGDSNVRYKNGNSRYRPLGKSGHNSGRNSRSYESVTRMVRGAPSNEVRNSMRSKTPVAGSRNGGIRVDGGRGDRSNGSQVTDSRFRGSDSVVTPRTKFDKPASRSGQSGLRIKTPDSYSRDRSENTGGRHVSSGADGQRRIKDPKGGINRTSINRSSSSRSSQSIGGSYAKPERRESQSSSTIRTVEPRKKGTRVWNNSSRSENSSRQDKPAQVKPSQRENDGSRTGKQPERIKPRTSKQPKSIKPRSSKQPERVKPRTTKQPERTKKSSGSSSTVKKSSSSSRGSSATKSSGGSSRSSGSRSNGRQSTKRR